MAHALHYQKSPLDFASFFYALAVAFLFFFLFYLYTQPQQAPQPDSVSASPQETGLSVLTPKAEASELASKPACAGRPNNYSCYHSYYRDLVREHGTQVAFEEIKLRAEKDSFVLSQCHPLTHVIGQGAAEKFQDVSDAFAEGDSYCWSGYYHGIMEGIIGSIPPGELQSRLDSVCSKIPGKERYSFDYYNCVHGLGHGVMLINGNDLFKSLEYCDFLSGGWERASCWSGVFMENVIIDSRGEFTPYLKPEEPLYPCSAVKDAYKQTCYLMQSSYMLKVSNESFARVFELCSTADEKFVDTCYQSLGRDASGRTSSDIARTKANCMVGEDYRQRSNCFIGAVKDFISYHHGDTQAYALCDALDAELQGVCRKTAESYYKIL